MKTSNLCKLPNKNTLIGVKGEVRPGADSAKNRLHNQSSDFENQA